MDHVCLLRSETCCHNLSSYFRFMVFEHTDFSHIRVQFTFLSLL